ncbi:hypothetical protein PT974_04023 [Cladobotryum mycophilum]|uniref:Transmembrane protein n=1 Tax=Cladobotryum mycophilum TaxID=491253 RepID=A0ABR0STZ7_9HYPO
MGRHRAQAQFERARWNLGFLAPVWALQLLLAMALMGIFAWRLGDTVRHYKEKDDAGKTPIVEFVWEGTNVVMSFVTGICTFVEIAKYVAESLTPWTMLFTHVIKLTCVTSILILDVVVYVQRSDEHYSLVGLGIDAALMVTAIAMVIYTIRAYRRLSTYDDYSHPVNVKGYGFNDNASLHRDNSYSSRLGLRMSMDKGSRLSFGSVSEPAQPAEPHMSRRYSHERDTQFDEYLNRRGPPREPLGDSVVVVGSVTRSRGVSVSQNPSFLSDHVLVAVPEEEGDVTEAADHRSTDSDTLLEQEGTNSDEDAISISRVSQPADDFPGRPKWQKR